MAATPTEALRALARLFAADPAAAFLIAAVLAVLLFA